MLLNNILYLNEHHKIGIQVYTAGRNTARIEKRFDGLRGKGYPAKLCWQMC